MEKHPTKTCDYCGNVGMAYTLLCGETICPLCLKDMPASLPEARQKIHALRQRIRQMEKELEKLLEAYEEVKSPRIGLMPSHLLERKED
jgi:uncharacterized Zn finger protein (UPF0148 family)